MSGKAKKKTEVTGPAPEAWEKQLDEGTEAFEAFRVFRDMGPSRTLGKVAKEVGKDGSLIRRWSSEHSWTSRVHYFDSHNDREASKKQEVERKQMIERHARSAMLLQAKALEALQAVDVTMLTTTDVVRWIEIGMKLERLTRGAGTPEEAAKSSYQALWERLGGPELEASQKT